MDCAFLIIKTKTGSYAKTQEFKESSYQRAKLNFVKLIITMLIKVVLFELLTVVLKLQELWFRVRVNKYMLQGNKIFNQFVSI